MRTIVSYINNLIFPIIPETRAFGLKRAMWRLAGVRIGKQVKISSSCKLFGAGELIIGDNTWIGYQTTIVSSSKITIGSNVDIAPRVYIGTGTHTINAEAERIAAEDISKDITIGDGCWLCVNSVILPGAIISKKCVIAAGAVVNGVFLKDRCLLAGVPAKIAKNYD